MNPEQYSVVKVASRNFQVVGPDGPVVDSDGQPVRFKSAGEAKAEIAASVADAAQVAAEDAASVNGEAAQVPQKARKAAKAADEAPQAPTLTDDDIAAMDRSARLVLALAEAKALSAWRANGGGDACDRPPTPVRDWMADPNSKPARKPSNGSQAAPVRTDEQEAQLRSIITERRAAGESWGKVAAALTEANIPTPRGGPWWDTTASDLAKRLELS